MHTYKDNISTEPYVKHAAQLIKDSDIGYNMDSFDSTSRHY